MQGKLIVFEGVEGSGKTTQLQRIQNWLHHQYQRGQFSHPVMATREPGGTALGQALRQLLLDANATEPITNEAELLLYAADRAQHVNGCLKPHLQQGWFVLCDRFTDSTIAYQGYGRGLDLDLIHQLNQIATQGLQSDLTLWFDIDVVAGLARAQKRGASDRMEQATLEFHQRVQQGFTQLAKDNPHRVVRIDASQRIEQVTQQVQQVLSQRLQPWKELR